MRVRIYKGASQLGCDRAPVILDGIEFISNDHAVEGLTIHGPNRIGEEAICVQAKPGQVFVRRGYLNSHLICYEAGHEVLEDGAEIVWDPRPAEIVADCPHCGKAIVGEMAAMDAGEEERGHPFAAVLKRDRYKCRAPECDATSGLQVHHIKPRSKGRDDNPRNLVTLCAPHHLDVTEGRMKLTIQGDRLVWKSGGETTSEPWREEQWRA